MRPCSGWASSPDLRVRDRRASVEPSCAARTELPCAAGALLSDTGHGADPFRSYRSPNRPAARPHDDRGPAIEEPPGHPAAAMAPELGLTLGFGSCTSRVGWWYVCLRASASGPRSSTLLRRPWDGSEVSALSVAARGRSDDEVAGTARKDERPQPRSCRAAGGRPRGAREPRLHRRGESGLGGVQSDPWRGHRFRRRELTGREGHRGHLPRSRQPRPPLRWRPARPASPHLRPRLQGWPGRHRQRSDKGRGAGVGC